VLAKSGKVYTGCNVESASFGATNCAERVALQKAVSEGEREFLALAVVGDAKMTMPCGICRQVISELAPEVRVLVGEEESYQVFTPASLLPHAFGPEDLL
jgi:cytidine deaminase